MSIRPIDRFIRAMHGDRAEELRFETGRSVRLSVKGVDRVLLAQNVRTDQIENILKDAVPSDSRRAFEDKADVSFDYTAPSGAVSITAVRRGNRLDVTVKPIVPTAPMSSGATKHGDAAKGDPLLEFLRDSGPDSAPPEPPVAPTATEIVFGTPPPVANPAPKANPRQVAAPIAAVTPVTKPAAVVVDRNKIDPLLRALVAEKGSDLHLTSALAAKIRKDGDIEDIPNYESALTSEQIEGWLLEIAPANMAEKFRQTHDADFAYEIPGLARFRVNVFRDRSGVGGVMRVIPSEILTADQLKLPAAVREFCYLQKGLVVVTGPTGSGKSTTLAAMVDLINKSRSDHIITIEDPVEFVHTSQKCLVNQREVHSHTASFSAALRAALREDPDIVLVGEMRDLETVAIAIETAETGHLVFGTLHTNTAISTVDRIIDQFPTDRQSQVRVMLSESLKGVVAQTLCKKVGGGRMAALEILIAVPAVAALIRDGKTFQLASIMQTQKGIGMQTLNDALMILVKEGRVTPKEAYTKAVGRSEMRQLLEKGGYRVD